VTAKLQLINIIIIIIRTILKWISKKYVDLYIGFHGVGYMPVAASVLQGNNHPEVSCLSEEATAHLLE
jgi:hypothetical protein